MIQRLLFVAAAATATLSAQIPTALFTGRFPFTGLDAASERPGGAINRLEEFDISFVVPVPGTTARTLLSSTTMQCYLGDGNNDGVYTKFAGWKTYFQQIGVGGVFVKAADRGNVTWDKVWFTVRRNAAAAGTASPGALQLEVLTNNGTTPQTLVPGDWIRLLPNGNVEFFLTAAQLVAAVGTQPGAGNIGAGALLQSATGDLYYAPVDGGHWVNGNGGAVLAQDGAILKIDAANIAYDSSGNVLSLAPNSARVLINEALAGPASTVTIRTMVTNSGAMSRDGTPVVATGIYGKTNGLAFDPNGGTFLPTYPDSTGAYNPEPNLLWVSEAASYASTVFSTNNNGSVAVINGFPCGSLTPGVPADGSWFGVGFDYANFQPTVLGFTLIDNLPAAPLQIDQNNFGSLPITATQPTWDVDVFGPPNTAVFGLLTLGPTSAGTFVPALPLAVLPPLFTPNSFSELFLLSATATLGVTITDALGYGTISLPNPNTGGFTGISFVSQAVALTPSGLQLSTPLLTQMQ